MADTTPDTADIDAQAALEAADAADAPAIAEGIAGALQEDLDRVAEPETDD